MEGGGGGDIGSVDWWAFHRVTYVHAPEPMTLCSGYSLSSMKNASLKQNGGQMYGYLWIGTANYDKSYTYI